MNTTWQKLSLIFLFLLLAGCRQDEDSSASAPVTPTVSPQPTEGISVFGFGMASELLKTVTSGFTNSFPEYKFGTLEGADVNEGVMALSQDVAQMIGMTRLPTDEERELVPDMVYVELGQTGIALFVAEDVGVTSLTLDQAQAIFTGEITNWSEVGGVDQTIRVFVRDDQAWATVKLRENLVGDTPFAATAIVQTSPEQMIESVQGTAFSVGYELWVSVLVIDQQMQPLALEGALPTDPDYPILTPVGIAYREKNQTSMDSILEYLDTEAGQALMTQFGVIWEK